MHWIGEDRSGSIGHRLVTFLARDLERVKDLRQESSVRRPKTWLKCVLRTQGLGWRTIAREMKVSYQTVRRALKMSLPFLTARLVHIIS